MVVNPKQSILDELKNQLGQSTINPKQSILDELKNNRLQFAEVHRITADNFVEVELKLLKPVFLDNEDIKTMLSLIEGVPIKGCSSHPNRPQLTIKNIELTKKKGRIACDLTVIKREKT